MAALGKLGRRRRSRDEHADRHDQQQRRHLGRSLKKLRGCSRRDSCPESVREDRKLNQLLSMVEDIARINQIACERIVAIVG